MGILKKTIYWINLVTAFLLAISFILPYIPPRSFPTLSILSLVVSPLILINILFLVYWTIRLKWKLLISLSVLLISHFHFNPFFEFSDEKNREEYPNKISMLTYNVRLFNAYEENPVKNAKNTISDLLNDKQPDIVFIQEYYHENEIDFSGYLYEYIHYNDAKGKFGHAIFSKFPLLNKGAFDFKDSNNNTLFADVVKAKDTFRVYNLHLQSLGIKPTVSSLQEENKERLRVRISRAFTMQQGQMESILDHKNKSPYPVLLCGDFNNTSFSYVYRKLQMGMKDAFVENGNGIGTTYLFDSYPMRIDYILTSKELEVIEFERIKNTFSDHYPVFATMSWE